MNKNHWLISPAWDGLWVFSGLWFALLILGAYPLGKAAVVSLLIGTGVGSWFFGWGHMLSPVITAWTIKDFRSAMLQDKRLYIFPPLLILVIVFSLTGIALYTHGRSRLTPLLGLGVVYFLWNSWHFAMQHFGFLSIYRHRAGQREIFERNADRLFCFLATFLLVGAAWYVQGARFGLFLDWVPRPRSITAWQSVITMAAVLPSAGMIVYEWRKPNASIPKLFYYALIGIQPVLLCRSYGLFSLPVFTASHWIAEVGLMSKIHASNKTPLSPVRNLRVRFIAGVGLFAVLSFAIQRFDLFDSQSLFWEFVALKDFSAKLDGLAPWTRFCLLLLTGGFISSGLYHFLYDYYLFSFRRAAPRNVIAPLMLTTLEYN